jgi:hypothetical protein
VRLTPGTWEKPTGTEFKLNSGFLKLSDSLRRLSRLRPSLRNLRDAVSAQAKADAAENFTFIARRERACACDLNDLGKAFHLF